MQDGMLRRVWPVEWTDDDGEPCNLWSRNRFTGEIEPDLEGEPLYTTMPPREDGHG